MNEHINNTFLWLAGVKHLPRVMIFVLKQLTTKMIHSLYQCMDNRTDHLWKQLLILSSGLSCTAAQVVHCPTPGGYIGDSVNGLSNKRYCILKSMTGEANIHFIHLSTILGLGIRPWTKCHLTEMISHQEINTMGIVHGAMWAWERSF